MKIASLEGEPMTHAKVADIIVRDTIRSAFSTPGLNGDSIIESGIATLRGEGGLELSSSMLREYMGDPRVDVGVVRSGKPVAFHSEPLREEMIRGLEAFHGLPVAERRALVRTILEEQI